MNVILYFFYLLPLGRIIHTYNIPASAIPMIPTPRPNCPSDINCFRECLEDIKSYIDQSLNDKKKRLHTSNLAPLSPYFKPHATDLAFIFDSALKFDKPINAVVMSSFF